MTKEEAKNLRVGDYITRKSDYGYHNDYIQKFRIKAIHENCVEVDEPIPMDIPFEKIMGSNDYVIICDEV